MERFISIKKNDDISILDLSFNEINLEQREELKKDLDELVRKGETKFIRKPLTPYI